jgi:hypothetical protein
MSILSSNIPVPIIYVSHLPSASSFYASLAQPLGIQFLSHANVSPACLNYGYISQSAAGPRKTVVFSVTESATPSLSHITLSAPSAKAVAEFHAKSWVLNHDLRRGENILEKGTDEERAVTRDFDGNMIEAVYNSRAGRGPVGRGPPVLELETASTEKEAKRVLEWQEDVARSIVDTEKGTRSNAGNGGREGLSKPLVRRAESFPLPVREAPRLVRRETVTTTEMYHNSTEKKDANSGTGNAILGSLLGVAAVAGFAAYALTARPASPEPIPARRASAGDGARGGNQYVHGVPQQTGVVERERIMDTTRSVAVPARSYISERGGGDDRERVQPSYVNYTVASPMQARELKAIDERSYHSSRAPSRVAESRYERESQRPRTIAPDPSPERVSAREHGQHEKERERDPSPGKESHVSRRSHRSYHSHKSSTSRSPKSRVSTNHTHREDREDKSYYLSGREEKSSRDRERDGQSSYTTARSHYSSASTVKMVKPEAPAPPPAASLVSTSTARADRPHRRRKSSHVRRDREGHGQYPEGATSHSHYSSSPTHRERERERDRDPSHVPLPESVFSGHSDRTARHVPLPESVAGHSEWDRGSVRMVAGLGREYNEYKANGGERAGYAASVAPSDSISSVGIKRERERMRERMRERETVGGGGAGGW